MVIINGLSNYAAKIAFILQNLTKMLKKYLLKRKILK